jgi:hypothetical protein
MASDYNGPATFLVEGTEYQVIVAVAGTGGDLSTEGGVSTGDVTRETFGTGIHLVGGAVADVALDKTGDLRCADGQTFTGEFNAEGEFHPAGVF